MAAADPVRRGPPGDRIRHLPAPQPTPSTGADADPTNTAWAMVLCRGDRSRCRTDAGADLSRALPGFRPRQGPRGGRHSHQRQSWYGAAGLPDSLRRDDYDRRIAGLGRLPPSGSQIRVVELVQSGYGLGPQSHLGGHRCPRDQPRRLAPNTMPHPPTTRDYTRILGILRARVLGRRLQDSPGLLLAKANRRGYAPGLRRASKNTQDTSPRYVTKKRHIVWEDCMAKPHPSWPVDRRTILKTSAALAAVQFSSPFIIKARGETPVRIGMVDPLTGVYAAIAQGEVVGAKFAAEEINKKGGILGRPVELLIEDSANDVGTGVQKTRKLIERDQVSFIVGDVNSGIAIAMAQVTSEKKVLHIVSGGHTDPITGANCSWNVFRVCNSTRST